MNILDEAWKYFPPPPNAMVQIKRCSSLFITYSNFCGGKVALTQVDEHRLPTYVSFAIILKVGVKSCMKFRGVTLVAELIASGPAPSKHLIGAISSL